MITPVLKDEAILADVAEARRDWQDLHLWWLGQSGFLVQWQNRHLLLDPYLSDSLTKKYAHTDKPHVRMTERVVAPERLDFIDVVASSQKGGSPYLVLTNGVSSPTIWTWHASYASSILERFIT